jgi:hypothetical protein
MGITATDILKELRDKVASSLGSHILEDVSNLEVMPVEVNWPDQGGKSGETRRVIAVHVENSGSPEVPTLRLICGEIYDEPEVEGLTDGFVDNRAFPGDPVNDSMPPQDANAWPDGLRP